MKNKKSMVLLLVLVLVVSLIAAVACDNIVEEIVKVSIKNKSALTQSWTVGEADRQLEAEVTVNDQVVTDKTVTVATSDAKIVAVGTDNKTLTAKGAGKATITVTVGEVSDSVEITVRPALASVSVTNKDALTAVWTNWKTTRTVELGFAPAEYYTAANTTAAVTCQPADLVDIDGYKLTAKKAGKATITVAVGDKSDSFEVVIDRVAPTIEFEDISGFVVTDEGGEMGTVEGTALVLPEMTATTLEGDEVTVSVSAPEGTEYDIATRKFRAPKGTYELTVTAVDKVDATKVVTKKITIGVFRNMFAWQDKTWQVIDELVPDNEQKVINTTGGVQLASFNIDPTDYYYAEVTFNKPVQWFGMAHFVTRDMDVNGETVNKEDHKRFLVSAIPHWAEYDFQNIDFDTNLSWTDDKGTNYSGWQLCGKEWDDIKAGANYFFHSYRLREYRLLNSNEDATIHKVAILRLGDYFVTFWNDQYVNMVTLQHYANNPSRPGLFISGGKPESVSNITYFAGQEAVENKYNELTANGSKIVSGYVPDSWAAGSKNVDNNHFTVGETTAEKGINFNYTAKDITDGNSSMVSTYQLFDGDFTFSWEYKMNEIKADAAEPRMYLEVRSYKYDNERTVFGAQYGGSQPRWLFNTPNVADPNKWCEYEHNFDTSHKLKFTITRHLTETASVYTMKTVDLDDPTKVHERTIEVTAAMDARWDKAVIMHWKNGGTAGEYSNIMWKNFNGQGNWVEAAE